MRESWQCTPLQYVTRNRSQKQNIQKLCRIYHAKITLVGREHYTYHDRVHVRLQAVDTNMLELRIEQPTQIITTGSPGHTGDPLLAAHHPGNAGRPSNKLGAVDQRGRRGNTDQFRGSATRSHLQGRPDPAHEENPEQTATSTEWVHMPCTGASG